MIAEQYIVKVSEATQDEFGNYSGDILLDHEAFTALELKELEVLEKLDKIDVHKRIKQLRKKLKHILKNDNG